MGQNKLIARQSSFSSQYFLFNIRNNCISRFEGFSACLKSLEAYPVKLKNLSTRLEVGKRNLVHIYCDSFFDVSRVPAFCWEQNLRPNRDLIEFDSLLVVSGTQFGILRSCSFFLHAHSEFLQNFLQHSSKIFHIRKFSSPILQRNCYRV